MEEKKIAKKLLNIQQKLKAPKNQRNNFGGYNYRSCEDILEAVKPLLKEENLIMTITDELVYIGERYYIKATSILTDIEENTQLINIAYAREEETKKGMDGSQITGTASSYARKYALNGLFLIDDQKDADTDEYTKQQEEEKATEKQLKIIEYYYKDENLKKLLASNNIEKIEELPKTKATEIIKKLNEKKEYEKMKELEIETMHESAIIDSEIGD